MKNKYLSELFIILAFLAILVICLNPLNIFMPPPLISMIIILLLIIFGAFIAIIWKEKANDERENMHKYFAGHLAFLVGSGVLVLAIAYQELTHKLDPFLIYILIIMLITKIIGRIYSDKKL